MLELTGSIEPDSSRPAHMSRAGWGPGLRARRTSCVSHARRAMSAPTDDMRCAVRDGYLVYAAAERFPGLVPTRAEVEVERRAQAA